MEWVCLWKCVPVELYTVIFTFAGNPLPQPPSQFLMAVSSDQVQLSDWQPAYGMIPALSRCFLPYGNWWTTQQPVMVYAGQLERHFPQVTYIILLKKLLSDIISFTKCWLLKDISLSATCGGSWLYWVPQLCKCGCTALHWAIGLLPYHSK